MKDQLQFKDIYNLTIDNEGKELIFELNYALLISGNLSPSDLVYEFKKN